MTTMSCGRDTGVIVAPQWQPSPTYALRGYHDGRNKKTVGALHLARRLHALLALPQGTRRSVVGPDRGRAGKEGTMRATLTVINGRIYLGLHWTTDGVQDWAFLDCGPDPEEVAP